MAFFNIQWTLFPGLFSSKISQNTSVFFKKKTPVWSFPVITQTNGLLIFQISNTWWLNNLIWTKTCHSSKRPSATSVILKLLFCFAPTQDKHWQSRICNIQFRISQSDGQNSRCAWGEAKPHLCHSKIALITPPQPKQKHNFFCNTWQKHERLWYIISFQILLLAHTRQPSPPQKKVLINFMLRGN